MTHITIENTYRIIAIFEPKRKRHLKCSCCGIQAKHQYLGVREHRALHQILLGGVRLYVCVRQPLIHCSYCDSQSVCYPKWLKAGKRYTEAFRMLVSLCRYMSCAKAIRNFARRISREADYIAHAISLKLTNAAIESFNRKIADLLRRGYGYEDLKYLSLKIHQQSTPHLSLDNLYTKIP